MARLERLDGLEIEEDLDFDIVEDLDGSSEYEDRRLLSGICSLRCEVQSKIMCGVESLNILCR
jgi:hypothetical protein